MNEDSTINTLIIIGLVFLVGCLIAAVIGPCDIVVASVPQCLTEDGPEEWAWRKRNAERTGEVL